MKFLCVDCDEAMALLESRGPDRGSMTVVFACPECGRRTAMLTNASETQVVRSLGVKIGGRKVEAEPMEGIRTGLAAPGDAVDRDLEDMSGEAASKCPFTGMVNEAFEAEGVSWSDEARARMEKIPSYVRSMVMKGVEEYARTEGIGEVTVDVLDRARGRLGM